MGNSRTQARLAVTVPLAAAGTVACGALALALGTGLPPPLSGTLPAPQHWATVALAIGQCLTAGITGLVAWRAFRPDSDPEPDSGPEVEPQAQPQPERLQLTAIDAELAAMADTSQRFLVWLQLHGFTGEQTFDRLKGYYAEFCELVDVEPEPENVLAKRLEQCGCVKPRLRWVEGQTGRKDRRQQFYVIPEMGQRHADSKPVLVYSGPGHRTLADVSGPASRQRRRVAV